MRADLKHVSEKNKILRRKWNLRKFVGRIAKCHSGRYGRVTGVKIGKDGRVIFTGHHVDPPGTQYIDGISESWRDWEGIPWQSVRPQWVG